MSIAAIARQDLRALIAFGDPVTLTAPNGYASPVPLMARLQDIAQVIDPQTRLPVDARMATATLGIPEIQAAGYPALPAGVASPAVKPWRVTIGTTPYKVSSASPDHTLGVVVLHLELYRAA